MKASIKQNEVGPKRLGASGFRSQVPEQKKAKKPWQTHDIFLGEGVGS